MGKERESANLVSTLTGIAVTISGDPVVLGVGNTEHFRITGSGLIGIATASPETLLTVAAPGSSAQIEIKRTNTNASGAVGALNFTAMDGHSVANIFAQGDGDNEGAHLIFKTTSGAAENDPYGSGTLERLRITSAGLVGIGTDGPATPLSVAIGSSTFEVHPHLDSGTTLTSFNRTSNSWQDLRLRGYSIKFSPQGNEKARVNSDGRFGIGTTSPDSFLHVEGDNANTLFRLKRTDAPAQILNDFGSGDSALKYTVNNASSYLLGVDDSDADRFKLSYGSSDNAAFGTNDLVSVTTAGNLEVDSGDLTLNGNLVGAINVTVADDAFASITPPREGGGWVFITTRGQGSTYPWSTGYAFAYMDWGASAQVSAPTGGASVATNTGGPPNGTTGADEKVTIFTGGTAGTLYVENRLGDTYSFQLTFI